MTSTKRVHIVSFLIVLGLFFIAIAWLLLPFINIVAFALIISILFHPVYRLLLKYVKKPAIASLFTVLLILILIAGPLVFFGQVIYTELSSLYDRFQSGALVIDRDQIVASLPLQLQELVQNFSVEFNNLVSRLADQAVSSSAKILGNVAGFVASCFIFVFIVYHLLKDAPQIKAVLKDISPLANGQEEMLIKKIVAAVNGVVKGSFIVALVQACVATVGYIIFGIPEPFLLGAFTLVAALVPNVGTALTIIPAVIFLYVTGNTPGAIGLAIWGAVAVGLIDNFIGPRLVGNSAKLHPVLVLLAVLGGLQVFGILGFLIGPILMAVFVAMIEMYREEFKGYTQSN